MGMTARKRKVAEVGDTLYPMEQRWHVTRGIPLALIFTVVTMFIGQTVGGIWYFAHQDSRLDVLEKAQLLAQPQGERLTRLEEKVVSVQATANRIEALLTKSR
jgi:Tfp pilus assembly protein PilN